ncbi:hypothetical protein AURDEDRAFT_174813 [Auricularia subglabra TFB-10046 SS5]|nr:hypothetical protein AURDEDRAFT_174813 [Auricularia subglabra TFB-10046 SS5]
MSEDDLEAAKADPSYCSDCSMPFYLMKDSTCGSCLRVSPSSQGFPLSQDYVQPPGSQPVFSQANRTNFLRQEVALALAQPGLNPRREHPELWAYAFIWKRHQKHR